LGPFFIYQSAHYQAASSRFFIDTPREYIFAPSNQPKFKTMREINKERITEFIKNFDLELLNFSEGYRKDVYNLAIENDYLMFESDLSEYERSEQRNAFNELVDTIIKEEKKKDFEREKKMFSEHYEAPIFAPQLRWNEKYLTPELENYMPIISIMDLCKRNYVICAIPKEKVEVMLMQLERTDIVIREYSSLDAMVKDGWRMGS